MSRDCQSVLNNARPALHIPECKQAYEYVRLDNNHGLAHDRRTDNANRSSWHLNLSSLEESVPDFCNPLVNLVLRQNAFIDHLTLQRSCPTLVVVQRVIYIMTKLLNGSTIFMG